MPEYRCSICPDLTATKYYLWQSDGVQHAVYVNREFIILFCWYPSPNTLEAGLLVSISVLVFSDMYTAERQGQIC